MSVLRSMYQAWKGQTVRRVLGLLLFPAGSITGEQDAIVEELTSHWKSVFEKPDDFDTELQERLCRHISPKQWADFRFTAADIQLVLHSAKDTTAGPDGMTYRLLCSEPSCRMLGDGWQRQATNGSNKDGSLPIVLTPTSFASRSKPLSVQLQTPAP
eukprot:4368082-Amphidinium_carterae.1